MTREPYQQTHDTPTIEGGAPMNRDRQPMARSAFVRWHTSRRATAFRVVALTLLVCASILGASANSSHPARAARATTNVPAAYAIKSVSVSVSPTSFAGLCSPTMTFTFIGTITLFPGYGGDLIPYTWNVNGAPQFFGNASGNAGDVTIPVRPYVYNMPAGSGTGAPQTVQLTSTGMGSNAVAFSLTCYFTVTSVTISTSGGCSYFGGGLTYTGTVTIAPSPGGSLSYSWQRVNNGNVDSFSTTGSPVHVNPGQTTVSLTLGPFASFPTFPLPYVGTILVVVTPNMVYSSPVIRPC